ncbi:hypothetical protein SDC9_172911 [bioreactor metagenome]|uniref:Uncharacterized protein n=1 Tax=bioreactor metagenome TaxID=1076179 RepID=A0A645GH80_9ZZZZ
MTCRREYPPGCSRFGGIFSMQLLAIPVCPPIIESTSKLGTTPFSNLISRKVSNGMVLLIALAFGKTRLHSNSNSSLVSIWMPFTKSLTLLSFGKSGLFVTASIVNGAIGAASIVLFFSHFRVIVKLNFIVNESQPQPILSSNLNLNWANIRNGFTISKLR